MNIAGAAGEDDQAGARLPEVGVARALVEIRQRIESGGRDPGSVTVVAVTKGFGPAAVEAALGAGLADVGENYAAELLTKSGQVGPSTGVRWHYLGAVQRNKVARLAPVVSCWQSVGRASEAAAIARHQPGAAVLVQVDLAGRPGRGGVPPADVPALVASARDEGVAVVGLMAVGVPGPAEGSRLGFREVVRLADELTLPVRSLGMSDDLEIAVEEGSTMVRIGRALFGDRPSAGAQPGPRGGPRRP